MDLSNPFLRGMLSSQQHAQRGELANIQAMGGILSLQNQMESAPIQRELQQLQLQQARQGPQPKWQVSERFNPETGQKEKVIVDLNNPSNVLPFGGQESRPLSFQNTGTAIQGLDPLTGQPRGQSIPLGVSPNTQATLAQGDRHFNATLPIQQANAGANLASTFYNTGMGPMPIPGMGAPQGGGFSPAQLQAAPPAPQYGPRSPTPAGFPSVSPQEQAARDADSRRIVTAENNGGQGMVPTRNVVQPAGPQNFVPQGTPMGQIPAQAPQQPQMPPSPRAIAERAAKQPERIQSLRKEFNDVPEVKNYRTVLPIIESVRNAPNTPAGDIDVIYGVGKIMDPNSVVREGELNLVIKAGSPLQRFQGQLANIAGGGRLPASQRAELLAVLDSRVGQSETAYKNAVDLYTKSASAEGLPVDQIIQVTPSRRATDGAGAKVRKYNPATGKIEG